MYKLNFLQSGRYQLMSQWHRGEHTTIYQAHELRMFPKRRVLVLIYERRDSFEMAFEQAEILSTLNHPVLPKFLDYFVENGRSYSVLEYISGYDFETLLPKVKPPLPTDKVIGWAIQLCDVLSYLHNQQPHPIPYDHWTLSSLLLTQSGQIKLYEISHLTRFMPETFKRSYSVNPDKLQSPLSDIYGVGTVLHQILTYKSPRYKETQAGEYHPHASPELIAIVEKAMAVSPRDRYQSADEMKTNLLNFLITLR